MSIACRFSGLVVGFQVVGAPAGVAFVNSPQTCHLRLTGARPSQTFSGPDLAQTTPEESQAFLCVFLRCSRPK